MKHHESDYLPLSPLGDGRVYADVLRFKDAGSFDRQLGIAEELGNLTSEAALFASGAMFQDLACSHPLGIEQKIGFLATAQQRWEEALKLRQISSPNLGRHSQTAAVGLACLPLWASIAVDSKNPPLTALRKAYNQLIDIGMDSVVAVRGLNGRLTAAQKEKNGDLRGGISEISVLLLLQRFALKELGDNSWVAVPSLLRQNLAKKRKGTYVNKAWDVSVFTQANPEDNVELTYKVQVKTRHSEKDASYAPGIQLVAVRDDLADLTGETLPFDAIVMGCAAERDRDFKRSPPLERRTDKLLDILG